MTRPCPTCGEPAQWEDNPDRPFCSERCRMLDLGRWATESYAIEGDEAEDFPAREGCPEDFQPS